MSAFQFAGVICTPIHAITIGKMGRKNAMIVGTGCMLIANTGLGMLALIPNGHPYWFFCVSLIIRFLQGYGDTLATTTALSLITTNYTEDKQKYISFMEAAGGLGLMVGPSIGSFLYGFCDYAWTFYTLSIFIAANLAVSIIFIPQKLNNVIDPSYDRNVLLSSFIPGRSYISVVARSATIDNHNVKNILEHLDNSDPKNEALIAKGISLD